MKYSFVMPYINRAPQLWNTLLSYAHWYKGRQDFEVIIIEDQKTTHEDGIAFTKVVRHFTKDLFIRPYMAKKNTYNPAAHYNQGVNEAWGKYIILTNPECMHTLDILRGFDYFKNEGYIVCSCKNKKSVVDYPQEYHNIILEKIPGDIEWYHHSKRRNAPYHWCSHISKEDYLRIGGFDEKYSDGIAFEDLDFLDRVRRSNIKIRCQDNYMTVHQQHDKLVVENAHELTMKNKAIYDSSR